MRNDWLRVTIGSRRRIRNLLLRIDSETGSSPSPSTTARSPTRSPPQREELGAWWEAVPVDDPPPRDELMLKVLMAIEHGPKHTLDVLTASARRC
jgi:hypothetical protein